MRRCRVAWWWLRVARAQGCRTDVRLGGTADRSERPSAAALCVRAWVDVTWGLPRGVWRDPTGGSRSEAWHRDALATSAAGGPTWPDAGPERGRNRHPFPDRVPDWIAAQIPQQSVPAGPFRGCAPAPVAGVRGSPSRRVTRMRSVTEDSCGWGAPAAGLPKATLWSSGFGAAGSAWAAAAARRRAWRTRCLFLQLMAAWMEPCGQ